MRKGRRRPNPLMIAEQARIDTVGRCEADGQCQEVSDAVVERLQAAGYDAYTAYGTYKGEPHAWVVVEDRYIDPTCDQFEEDEYICAGKLTDKKYRRNYRGGF